MSTRVFFSILSLLLSACSVHGLYTYDPSIYNKLAQVKLGKVEGKNLYVIRQSFTQEFYLKGSDFDKPKDYVLNIKLNDSVAPWLIKSDSDILKSGITLAAIFELHDIRTGKVLKRGNVRVLRTFSESPSAWSSYTSEKKAYENAVSDVLQSIRMTVITYFSIAANENKHKTH